MARYGIFTTFVVVGALWAASALAGPRVIRDPDPGTESQPEEETPVASEEVPVEVYTVDRRGVEIGARVGYLAAWGDWLDSEGTAHMGGVGSGLRWRFLDDLAFEYSVDLMYRESESSRFYENRMQQYLGMNWYFGDPTDMQMYVGGGLSIGLTFLEAENDLGWIDTWEYSELGPYAAFGGDFYADQIRFNVEVRAMHLSRMDDIELDAAQASYNYTRSADESRGAMMLSLGCYYSF